MVQDRLLSTGTPREAPKNDATKRCSRIALQWRFLRSRSLVIVSGRPSTSDNAFTTNRLSESDRGTSSARPCSGLASVRTWRTRCCMH